MFVGLAHVFNELKIHPVFPEQAAKVLQALCAFAARTCTLQREEGTTADWTADGYYRKTATVCVCVAQVVVYITFVSAASCKD